MLKFLKGLLIGLAIVVAATGLLIATLVLGRTSPELEFESSESWAHMGLHTEAAPNTLEAFMAAFDAGAAGVEMDIQYLAEYDRFIVAHDLPEELEPENLLYLEPVLRGLEGRGRIWLDFKNLSMTNLEGARSRLQILFRRYGFKERAFVEARDGLALRGFADEGFQTIYWISYNPDRGPFSLRQLACLFLMYSSEYSAISLPATSLTDGFFAFHPNIPIFTFTVNKPEEIDRLLMHSRVRVVLTDLNYFPILGRGDTTMFSPK